jgi:F-type H+-transporting ATPase subunit epsilon
MSQAELQVKILSPERVLFRGAVTSLGLPGAVGYMTLLPGHTAMVAELESGILAMSIDGKAQPSLFISGGFVDVTAEGVSVLADVIEKATEIDGERVTKALGRANERLQGNKSTDIDVPRALSAKKRALHRLELVSTSHIVH